MKTLFDYLDYKTFLTEWAENPATGGKGAKLKLAATACCNPSFVSQVLRGHLHFSLEQAERICGLLGFTEEATRFFLLLVQKDRAGTKTLGGIFMRQIQEILEKRNHLIHRLEFAKTISKENRVLYYSSWHYMAVHMALSVPRFNDAEAVAKYLALPLLRVSEVIEFLLKAGIIEISSTGFRTGQVSIHLGYDSPMIAKNHANWRIQSIDSVDRPEPHDLHYSSVVTIAKEDALKIKTILVEAIESVRATVKKSKEDSVYCYTLDLFSLER